MLVLLLVRAGYSQVTQTQCNIITGQNNVSGILANLTNRFQFNNQSNYCNVWTLTWWAPPSSNIATVEIDGADDNGGVPGTWTAFPNTPTTGANPSQIGNEVTGIITVNGFKPWVSAVFFCQGSAPCGTVTFDLHGTASQAITPLSGSGINVLPLIQFVGSSTSTNIFNAGQTSHHINIQIIQVPLKTCASTDLYDVTFSGVQQNGHTVLLMALEARGNSAPTGGTAFGFATGLFPSYQVSVSAFGNASTNCEVSVWYTGFPNIGFSSQSTNTYGTTGVNPIPSSNIHPISECSINAQLNVPANTATVLIGPFISGTVKVCQLIVTSSAAAVFSFGVQIPSSNCVAFPNSATFNMVAGVPITVGGSLGAAITVQKGFNLCAFGSAATVGFISYDIF